MSSRDLIERVRKALGDRYNVITAVGRGGNASIFGAYDRAGQKVAIKVLHPELAVSVAADRFLREIRYASQLDHPHIARLLDSGESDYLLWFAMPYLAGETLRQVLRREARLPVDRATRIACEVLDALGHAHQHGIAHRDIKPDNIVLSPQGAVLVDLGIARAIATSGDDRVTRSGFVVGTEEYMSPEQAAGAPDVDGRTDLYSLGVVLFEALAGRPPFSSVSAAAVLDMHQHQKAPDVRSLRRDVPKGISPVLARALAKQREERWQTATEMREGLLADRTRISEPLERRGARAPFRIGFGTGLAIARELGAGRLVMGQLWSAADTLRLTVGVYDAARGGPPLREAKARMAANSTRAGTAFDALADSLLAADPGAFSGAGTEQTHSIAALRAYTQGARAIRTWDLASATQHLRAAIAADSDFARAYASLGQVLLWAADSTPQAMRDRAAIARRTGGLLEQLGTTERPLLLAQQAMFERRWPDACARYREVLQRDSANFDAWYGLAQCNAEDPVVIRDPADTMRFVFRGSWHTAVLAYTKALLLAPSFNFVFGTRARQRLAQLLLAEEFWWRRGRLDTLPYFAFPEIEADSLAFHPISGATIARGTRLTTHTLALARNRQSLVDVTAAWAGAFPQDPGAHRAFAYALEVSGRIAPVVGELHSALAEIAAAQRLERQPSERLRDAVAAPRLLVKT